MKKSNNFNAYIININEQRGFKQNFILFHFLSSYIGIVNSLNKVNGKSNNI